MKTVAATATTGIIIIEVSDATSCASIVTIHCDKDSRTILCNLGINSKRGKENPFESYHYIRMFDDDDEKANAVQYHYVPKRYTVDVRIVSRRIEQFVR